MTYCLLGVIILLLLAVGSLLLPVVQTSVAKEIVTILFSEDNIDVDLLKLEITPFSEIEINGLYLSDQQRDTLLYANSLKINIKDWHLSPFSIAFNTVELDSAKFYLNTSKGNDQTNLQFVLDRFSSEEKDTSTTSFEIASSVVSLQSVFFKWNDFNLPDTSFGVNFNHLEVAHFDLEASELAITPDEIQSIVSHISLNEKSGFQLSELKSVFTLNDEVIDLDELILQTPSTRIEGSYAMKHNAYNNFSDYVQKVKMLARLDSSVISSTDLAFFVPQLEGMEEVVVIDGLFEGTVSSFEMERFNINLGNASYLIGKMDVHGLPEINTTQMNVYLTDGYVLKTDLERIPLVPFSSGKRLKLPEDLKKWKYAKVKGNYFGTIKNFVADASFKTNLGSITTDVQVNNNSKLISYSGEISFKEIRIGHLIDNKNFNLVTGNLKVKGKGNSAKTADVFAKGRISTFDFNGYRYKDIRVNGNFKNELFVGNLDVNDKLCELTFDGKFNLKSNQDSFRFKLKVDTLFPVLIGLYERDSSAFISGELEIDLVGLSIDTTMGTALLSNLYYQEKDSSFYMDSLTMESFVVDSLREVHISSSIGEIALKGDAVLKGADEAIAKILDNALPTYFKDEYDVMDNKGGMVLYASFNKSSNKVLGVFAPEFKLDSSLEIRSGFFLDPPLLNFSITSNGISYSNFVLDSFELAGGFADSVFNVNLFSDTISLNENIRMENAQLNASFSGDSIDLFLDYFNTGEKSYGGQLNLAGKIKTPTKFGFQLSDAFVVVADSTWRFAPKNYIEIDSNYVNIDHLEVSSNHKFIKLDGRVGSASTDSIRLNFNDLNLSNVGRMLNRDDIQLSGTSSGKVVSISTATNPLVLLDVSIDALELNEMAIGSGKLISEWNSELARAEVDFDLIRLPDSLIPDTVHSLKMNGFIYPNREEENLDLRLGTQGFYLRSLEPFTKSFMDSLDGRVTGFIGVTGEFDHPVLQGEFDLVDSRFRVKYLNTTYYAKNEKLRIEEDWFGFDNLKLTDQNGNKANTIATVYHTNFTDINYDISVNMKDFLVLNTTANDNDMYYGTGYLTGDVDVFGYDQLLFLELNAKTAKRSEFIIPLSGSAEIGQSDFITFVNEDGLVEDSTEQEIDLSGIEMTFNLEVDPSAKVRMIFDETTGDELSSRGAGNLKLQIDSKGDFEMFGKYQVESGDYGFTFKNAFSKKFILEKGGTIAWNGDPLNAEMNVTAIYNVRAPLGDILNDSTLTTKVNNECLMNMSGRLSEPTINFDIRLPNASPGIAQQVKSQMSTPEEVQKQVFSLMLFNRYSPPQGGLSASGVGSATSSDLISNQLNNWISKMDNQLFDVGVSEIKSDEVEIALSKKLLDDRLILESNVGVNRTDEAAAQGAEQNSSGQFVGDFKLEYLITENGKIRGKVFNRTENRSSFETQDGANAQTQGVGIVLREDFNSAKELWRKMFNNPVRKKKRQDKKAERAQRKAAKRDD